MQEELTRDATGGRLSIRNVTKIYDPEGVNVMAVDNCSMEIAAGEVAWRRIKQANQLVNVTDTALAKDARKSRTEPPFPAVS